MGDPAGRLLHLLSLLQRRPHWTGPALADRLEVTVRTVRRDIDRLRELGYPVDASPGAAGGYSLGVGAHVPPLLLDDDESTAVAVALAVSTGRAVSGIEEPALAALAKLDRLLPARLKHQVDSLRASVVPLAGTDDAVAADLLVALAQACAGHERLVIDYRDRQGQASERRIEPERLVSTGRRWYLVAHDLDRRAWRTFRVDRIAASRGTGHRFEPAGGVDAAALVSDAITTAPYRHQAVVRFLADPATLRHRVPPTVGVVEADGTGSLLTLGADDVTALAGHLVALGLPFEAVEPPELRRLLHRLGQDLAADHGPLPGHPDP